MNIRPIEKMIHNTKWLWLQNILNRNYRPHNVYHDIFVSSAAVEIIAYVLQEKGPMQYGNFVHLLYLTYRGIMEQTGIDAAIPFIWGDWRMHDDRDRSFIIG